jgi:hypothetical protein
MGTETCACTPESGMKAKASTHPADRGKRFSKVIAHNFVTPRAARLLQEINEQ